MKIYDDLIAILKLLNHGQDDETLFSGYAVKYQWKECDKNLNWTTFIYTERCSKYYLSRIKEMEDAYNAEDFPWFPRILGVFEVGEFFENKHEVIKPH